MREREANWQQRKRETELFELPVAVRIFFALLPQCALASLRRKDRLTHTTGLQQMDLFTRHRRAEQR